MSLTSFIYLLYLISSITLSVDAKRFSPRRKVGTWGSDITEIICITKPDFRKNYDVFKKIDRAFLRTKNIPVLPPRRHSISKLQSEYLGVLAYAILIPLDYEGIRIAGQDKETPALMKYIRWEIEERIKLNFRASGDPKKYPFEECNWGTLRMEAKPRGEEWYQIPPKDISDKQPSWWPPEPSFEEKLPNSDISIARNSLPDLSSLSWPLPIKYHNQAQESYQIQSSYYHNKDPGKGVVVYILDTGFDRSHPDLRNAKVQDWVSGGLFPAEKGTDEPLYDGMGPHGSGVASKIAGMITGVAQGAEIIPASCVDGDRQIRTYSILDCMIKTYDHIRKNNSDKPCVINFAMNLRGIGESVLANLLKEFNKLRNVAFVTSAGNKSPVSNHPVCG
ncbi:hypothetical protein TWF281_004494 [Arthrobotrys megalospora]